MRVLQTAIGSQGTSSNHQASTVPPTDLTEPVSTTDPTSEDFYSVIYIFTSSASSPFSLNTLPPPSVRDPQSRGIWHLARCLLALQSSYRQLSPVIQSQPQSLAPPHLAWADCTAAEFLLKLKKTDAFPRFLRMAAAYQNLTSAFGRWPAGLMGGEVGKELPIPEFLKSATLDTPSRKPDVITGQSSDSSADTPPISIPIPSPPTQPLPSVPTFRPTAPLKSQDGGFVQDLGSSTRGDTLKTPSSEDKEGNQSEGIKTSQTPTIQPILPPDIALKQDAGPEFSKMGVEGEREVVLPAAMGGSWKETMYMRLNNKVLQLQSDVSVSMRYLEELSQSYKRQTERLSVSFNLTTAWLKATAKGAEERDLLQQERIDVLEAQLTKLLHILAEQGIVEFVSTPNHNDSSSPAPLFRRPLSPSSGVNFQSLFWSVFFKPPATSQDLPPPSSKGVCDVSSTSTTTTRIASIGRNAGGGGARGGRNFNISVFSPMRDKFTVSKGSKMMPVGSSRSRMSHQASLLFLRGQNDVESNTDDEESETTKLKIARLGVTGARIFTCILAVFSRFLREYLLSETFRLWLLHVCFAVIAQILVYVTFMRSLLRRSFPTTVQHHSLCCSTPLSPPCKNCSSCGSASSSFSLVMSSKGSEPDAEEAEDEITQPGLSCSLISTAIKEDISLWEESLKPLAPIVTSDEAEDYPETHINYDVPHESGHATQQWKPSPSDEDKTSSVPTAIYEPPTGVTSHQLLPKLRARARRKRRRQGQRMIN